MNGEVVFKDLQKGVYLFVQPHKKHIGNRIYQSEPFIVTVPGYYDGQVVWDVIIEPKFKNESIPPIVTKTLRYRRSRYRRQQKAAANQGQKQEMILIF